MWLLENEGLFQGRRKWLRPGTRHLLGRTRDHKDGVGHHQYIIDSKTVSRQHLVIDISDVEAADAADLSSKSTIRLTDNSKFGTSIDGERFTNSTRALTKDAHTIKLGKYEHDFKITWHPVVIAVSVAGKKKQLRDPLADERGRLGPLEIKTDIAYNIKTTHVVADKRNTSMGLQALVNAKHIVLDTFVDAVVRAATSAPGVNDQDGPQRSLLEEDFDQYWPQEIDYLPPVGNEPVHRSPEFFIPNSQRGDVFAGYTFIFGTEAQYNNLQAAISEGSGKSLLYDLKPGETTVEEFVEYIKNVAGEKGLEEFEDGSEGKGVVCVRIREKKGFEKWTQDLENEVQLRLNQRSVVQNEFLDAILMKDASVLRRRLEEDEDILTSQLQPQSGPSSLPAVPSTTPAATQSKTQQEPQENETQKVTTKRKPRRAITQSRFKGFGDSDDEDTNIIQVMDDDSVMEDVGQTQGSNATSRHGDTQYSQSQPQTQRQETTQRKRPHEEEPTPEENLDKLLPAAAAIKRRKIRQGRLPSQSPPAEPSPPKPTMARLQKAARSKDKQIDVKAALRERKEAEEEAERRRAEEDDEPYDDDEISALRDLAIVEEMDIKPREQRPARKNQARSDRWDDSWNGRKNFKKFRRQGQSSGAVRGHKVIVRLEEAKKKEVYGMNDDFWLEEGTRENADAEQDEVVDDPGFRSKRPGAASKRKQREEREDDLIEQLVAPPRKGRTSRAETPARSEAGSVASATKGKRAAAEAPAGRQPTAKRGRIGMVFEEEEEPTGFKFKRGGRKPTKQRE